MVDPSYYLILGALLFFLGVIGVVIQRNAITVFICIELMLNAVNLTLVTLDRYIQTLDGQVYVIFVMTVAAAEAAVGLAIIYNLFRQRGTAEMDDIHLLKG